MRYRDSEIYIQGNTKRRLRWLAKGLDVQLDELADEMLNAAIIARYPKITELEAEFEKAKTEFLASLAIS